MHDDDHPRLNHVAMSVAKELLEAPAQAELLEFYGEVMGWTAMPTMGKPGELLVLRAHSNEQFIFLAGSTTPMTCPSRDHFGLSVSDPGTLYALHDRALAYQKRDARVEIVPPTVEDYKVLALHSFYLRYRLPMMIELQCFEWARGASPASLPD